MDQNMQKKKSRRIASDTFVTEYQQSSPLTEKWYVISLVRYQVNGMKNLLVIPY